MNVLFITSSRLGDAVLSTGLLDHIIRENPGANVTIACGALPASLFEGVPGLKEVIAMKKQSFNRHWLKLWMKVSGVRWDIVVDLRDSVVSRLIFARKKYIYSKYIDKNLHKVEQNAAVMKLAVPPAPRIWVSGQQARRARELIPDGDGSPVLGVGPTANWIGKTWPADRFVELVKVITAPEGILPGARVALFAAPGEEAAAREVLHSILENRRIDVIARADPGTVVAALGRCALYVGNDSGLMHGAAAAGTPTFGLFGPSWPHIYRPWGAHTGYIATPETFAQLVDFPGYDPKALTKTLMTSLGVENVSSALRSFWHTWTNDKNNKHSSGSVGYGQTEKRPGVRR